MEDEHSDRERLIRSLGAGFLVRWDQHDRDSLVEEVGPMTRTRTVEREPEVAWFD